MSKNNITSGSAMSVLVQSQGYGSGNSAGNLYGINQIINGLGSGGAGISAATHTVQQAATKIIPDHLVYIKEALDCIRKGSVPLDKLTGDRIIQTIQWILSLKESHETHHFSNDNLVINSFVTTDNGGIKVATTITTSYSIEVLHELYTKENLKKKLV